MLSFSRLALLSALTVAAVNASDCVTDKACQKVICDVFEDACTDDHVCQQLDKYPWFLCHEDNEVDSDECKKHGCGGGTECIQGMETIYCTCDKLVVPIGVDCTGATSKHTCKSMTCPETASCDTDGESEFCVCDDGTVIDEYIKECPSPDILEKEQHEEEEFTCSTGLNCHKSATCHSNGMEEFCVCQSGKHVLPGQICRGWTRPVPPVKAFTPSVALPQFNCTTCGKKACMPFEGTHAAGCMCNKLLVDPEYPCYHDAKSDVALTCENYCMKGAESVCFIEHGVPACRCSDGDLVGKDVDCKLDRTDTYTAVEEGGCAFDVCGKGAVCHHQEKEGYTCTCGVDEKLTAHYQDCEM